MMMVNLSNGLVARGYRFHTHLIGHVVQNVINRIATIAIVNIISVVVVVVVVVGTHTNTVIVFVIIVWWELLIHNVHYIHNIYNVVYFFMLGITSHLLISITRGLLTTCRRKLQPPR